jgi:hypothetical protein
MRKSFYKWTRDLHLYFGLFLCPFVLVFAVSTVVLNHPGLMPGTPESPAVERTVSGLEIPEGIERLSGMERIRKLQPILRKAGVSGEVEWVRYQSETSRMIVPVMKPGETSTLDLNLKTRTATVRRTGSGLLGALVYLHKSPGPHLINIRGNWLWTEIWRPFADGAAYLILFLAVSGIYLWAVLRAERRTGLILLGTGFAVFTGLLYALAA